MTIAHIYCFHNGVFGIDLHNNKIDISNEKDLVIDEYTKNGSKIEVYYSLGEKNKIPSPAGEYEAYDMYGNPIEIGGKITVTNSPVYIVY